MADVDCEWVTIGYGSNEGGHMGSESDKPPHEDECVVHDHPVPPEEVGRYSVEREPAAEQDIANYVNGQARDETVQHVERIKTDYIMGKPYEIWDVTTDKNRWWIITNLTNLYLQKYFPSLDYTLSFHVGLMMRLRSRPEGADSSDPSPFDEVFRRQEQAKQRYDRAIEAEDYQAVGMQLRECLISLVGVMRRRVELLAHVEKPQDANFIGWARVLMDQLCAGKKNKELRQYMKAASEKTWQLVNWLTHDRNANKSASSIAIEGCDMVVGHYIQLLMRGRTDRAETCPRCSSRNIRTNFEIAIEPDGAYFDTCGACEWTNHPGYRDEEEVGELTADDSEGDVVKMDGVDGDG
ncbi:MAG: gamma-glutamylcyclotransferase [Proteobacteria bacterium]|nr:gamma-glutamylcyclotransferase [Pseudomonadota bacterium]